MQRLQLKEAKKNLIKLAVREKKQQEEVRCPKRIEEVV